MIYYENFHFFELQESLLLSGSPLGALSISGSFDVDVEGCLEEYLPKAASLFEKVRTSRCKKDCTKLWSKNKVCNKIICLNR